jgi:hypothetical protein
MFRRLGLHPGPDLDVHAAAALAGVSVDVARRQLETFYTDHLIEETQPGRHALWSGRQVLIGHGERDLHRTRSGLELVGTAPST